MLDMFQAIHDSGLSAGGSFTVSVGPISKQTRASWYLNEPEDVIAFLTKLQAVNELTHEGL